MFRDSPVDGTGFKSVPEKKRADYDSNSQTTPIPVQDRGVQAVLARSSSSQTDVLQSLQHPPAYDSTKLTNFLNKVYPKLVQELNIPSASASSSKQDDEGYNELDEFSTTLIHSIKFKSDKKKAVSSLSWNASGTYLAVSLTELNHESWCTHDGQIHIYRITEENFAYRPAAYVLDTDACVDVISFSPRHPSILISGLHNGKIRMWDLTLDDPAVDGPFNESLVHTDGITNIAWIDHEPTLHLITTGRDGRIFVCEFSPTNNSLKVVEKYFISLVQLNLKSHRTSDNAEITGLSPCPNVTNEFVIAAGGTFVLHCSRSTDREISEMPDYFDPVEMKYDSHPGVVTCIKHSASDLLVTCGTDSEIRVYKSKKKSPVHVIHCEFPLFGIEWIDDHKSDLIAFWGSSPTIEFYRISSNMRLLSRSIKLDNSDTIVTTAKLNQVSRGMIAIGTMNGEASVWRISRAGLTEN